MLHIFTDYLTYNGGQKNLGLCEKSLPSNEWFSSNRTGFWDRQGANIASRYKELYGVELFLR